jgi:NAD(P)H dehydrogenase (quinone)
LLGIPIKALKPMAPSRWNSFDLYQSSRRRTWYTAYVATEERRLRHLVIAVHPNTKSFNHAVVEPYTTALVERGRRVECRDLYAEDFNPVMSTRDLAAIGRGKAAKAIRAEQAAIRRADVVTFVSPLWWSGFPAMLKGYLDRVADPCVRAALERQGNMPWG